MTEQEDVFDKKIWGLLCGQLRDREEIKKVAQVLNDEFIPKVMGVLRKLGVDEITAEGITKEAVDKAANSYQPGKAKFLTFVTRIALNIRIDRYRQGLSPAQPSKSFDEDTVRMSESMTTLPVDPDPPMRSEFMKKVDLVAPLLSQESRILIQFDIQGVPKESYMKLYSISESAYRQRKLRAYERLRDLYNEKHLNTKGG